MCAILCRVFVVGRAEVRALVNTGDVLILALMVWSWTPTLHLRFETMVGGCLDHFRAWLFAFRTRPCWCKFRLPQG